MKYKVSELQGALLDAAVAKCERYELDEFGYNRTVRESGGAPSSWNPSTDWAQGGPIIERERIAIHPPETARPGLNWEWRADCHGVMDAQGEYFQVGEGETALIAAMRAYVASKFGEYVHL